MVLTHLHADFLAGHLELRNRTGATVCLGASAKAEYAFRPLADGESIELGRVRLTALETPGPHPGVDLAPGLRPRCQRRPGRTPCSPATRCSSATSAVPTCARRWAGRRVAGRAALRLAAPEAARLARRQPGLSRARRWIAVRQGAQQGDVLDHRRAAARQLRAAADEPRGVHRAGHRRSARCPGLFRLRRGAQRQGASDAGTVAGRRTEAAQPRSGARPAARRRPGARHPRAGGVRRRPSGRQPEHRPGRPVRHLGRLDPRPAAADRDHRRGRPGGGIGDAPGPHRLRQGRRLPRRRATASKRGPSCAPRPSG